MTRVIEERAACERELQRAEGLHELVIRGLDLRGVSLTGRLLNVVRFFGCDLSGASLSDAVLRNVAFHGCDLRGASFERAQLAAGVLRFLPDGERCCDLRAADLCGASLADADLRGADLRGSQWTGAVAQRARAELCAMSRSQLVEVDLRSARLDHADLRYSMIERCQIEGASLRDANLEGASLHATREAGADLHGANLARVSRTNPAREKAEAFVPMQHGPSLPNGGAT